MPKLIVNPGSPAAWEIQLKPGANLIGRAPANDFAVSDPSVSGTHCRVTVNGAVVSITDLGSTNGTFVNRAPVKEAVLQPGQTVHLGGVEMSYVADAALPVVIASVPLGNAQAAAAAPPARLSVRAAPAPVAVAAAAAAPAIRLSGAPAAPAAGVLVEETPAEEIGEPPPMPISHAPTGPQPCKFHPRTPARLVCPRCHHYFCDLCVTSRPMGGVTKKICRHCGVECAPVFVQTARRSGGASGFFARLPSVFGYPFKGGGLFVLIIATIVFAALDFISAGLFAIFAKIVAIGYLFSFMQTIIHSTASEEDEMPGMPGLDDVGSGFMRMASAVVFSFGPALGLLIFAFFQEDASMTGPLMIGAVAFGCLYFPMAILAVAIKDTMFAANPLVVVPSLVRVPGQYVITVILLGMVFGLRLAGDVVIPIIFTEGISTKSMGQMAGFLGTHAVWKFVGIYLLAVNMRILGLLYLYNKERLGWIGR